jgi:hypothetical protein|tara:strand:- start:8 stop:271 length:264 start_codon:yes stop_codon:yes gene_type:complete
MKILNSKHGKIIKRGSFYYLEKNYKEYFQLIKEEDLIIDKVQENNFIYLDNDISFCRNPYFELDKLYGKKPRKIYFKNTFKLIHTVE